MPFVDMPRFSDRDARLVMGALECLALDNEKAARSKALRGEDSEPARDRCHREAAKARALSARIESVTGVSVA